MTSFSKGLLLFSLLILFTQISFAQSPIGQGGKQFNFGLGLNDAGFPIYAGMDFGIHPDITAGGQVALDLSFDWIGFSVRGDYHFNTLLEIPSDFDVYAGLNLGFVAGLDSKFNSGLDLGLQIGGRYYWDSNWGVNLEIGGGNNLNGGRLGLSKRF